MRDALSDRMPTPSARPRRTLLTELAAYADWRGSAFVATIVIIAGQAWHPLSRPVIAKEA